MKKYTIDGMELYSHYNKLDVKCECEDPYLEVARENMEAVEEANRLVSERD